MPKTTAANTIPAPALISHTYLRLRGTQTAAITVRDARTDTARVALTWQPGILMSFLNAAAAQGVLEGFSAARAQLPALPAEVGAGAVQLYDQPATIIDWTRRPDYAINLRSATTPDRRRTIHWADVYMGPVTFQLLDRAAFHSTVQLLRDAHTTAVTVCLDGHKHRLDPTDDDYRPNQPRN